MGKERKRPCHTWPLAMVMLMIAAHVRRGQPQHVTAEIPVLTRPQQQVKMVAHQAIGQQAHVGAFPGLAEELHEGGAVAVLVKDSPAAIASIEDVVAVSAQCIACAAWHTP